MKKSIFLFLFLTAFASVAFAVDYTSKYASTGSESKTTARADYKVAEEADSLIDRDIVNLGRTISDLQTRISNLERENKFQNERMRRMDRTITDLKRRS